MKKILNIWCTSKDKEVFYTVQKPIYTNGDYSIFKLPASYLHTYKDISIAELGGANKELIDHLVQNKIVEKENYFYFLLERAKANIRNNLSKITN